MEKYQVTITAETHDIAEFMTLLVRVIFLINTSKVLHYTLQLSQTALHL